MNAHAIERRTHRNRVLHVDPKTFFDGQIEQLARFNAKFEPRWVPRYMCFPGSLELPSVAIAALRAEAFLVLPSFGRRSSRSLDSQDEEEPLCR